MSGDLEVFGVFFCFDIRSAFTSGSFCGKCLELFVFIMILS